MIKELLSVRHSDDIFLSECRTGPSASEYFIMDGWAMKKSYASPLSIGYEIKVSRNDFMRDDKWRAYLDYCNEFYFVCPTGLIQPNELPDGIGLLWASKTGSKLFKKKKSEYRSIVIPEPMYKYILFSRSVIGYVSYSGTDKDYWEKWLKHKEINQSFGYNLSRTLRKTIDEEILKARSENARVNNLNESYEEIKVLLKKIGIDPLRPPASWALENKIQELNNLIPKDLEYKIKHTAEGLNNIIELIDKQNTCIKESA